MPRQLPPPLRRSADNLGRLHSRAQSGPSGLRGPSDSDAMSSKGLDETLAALPVSCFVLHSSDGDEVAVTARAMAARHDVVGHVGSSGFVVHVGVLASRRCALVTRSVLEPVRRTTLWCLGLSALGVRATRPPAVQLAG